MALYWNTVGDLLKDLLLATMEEPRFDSFRLVGGTSLSLQIGHRMSVDIDMFTDAPYGSIDFVAITQFFKDRYPYVATNGGMVGMGSSYYVGQNEQDAVKVDVYYTDSFIFPPLETDDVRLATVEEIIAMKMDVVSRGGRKKDFWDLHALTGKYTLKEMLQLHAQRYSYTHDEALIRGNMVRFEEADNDFDPLCLRGEYWELIKYDLIRWSQRND